MSLNGSQFEQFVKALLAAFPTLPKLKQMVRYGLDKNLDAIALGNDLQEIVSRLIEVAESEGWISQLLNAARKSNPGNPKLLIFAQQFPMASTMLSGPELERTIRQANGFLDVTQWRSKLGKLENQVCRIEIPLNSGGVCCGTGFLLGPDVLITNYHVMETVIEAEARQGAGQPWAKPEDVILRFDYKWSATGQTLNAGTMYGLATSGWLINSSPMSSLDNLPEPKNDVPQPDQLDYALLRLADTPGYDSIGQNFEPETLKRGWINVPLQAYDFQPHTPLFILQHPKAEPLKLAFDTDSIIGLNSNKTRITYRTNTEGGSSGSPCFNINWELVALHHAGDPDFTANYQPTYNQGIPFTAILALLEQQKVKGVLGEQEL